MAVDRKGPSANSYAATAEDDDFNLEDRPQSVKSNDAVVHSGWEAAEQFSVSIDFPAEFKHDEKFQLVKFIDGPEGPYASYKMHWLKQKTTGQRSYVCLASLKGSTTTCPLCTKLGDKPEQKTAFSIVNFSVEPVQRQKLIASARLYKSLHAAEFSPQGPLRKNFWAMSRTGVKQQTTYNLQSVKARDLQEDWGLDPEVVEAQLAEFKPFTFEDVRTNSYAELLEIAEDLA